jgi:hypothetical protein
MKEDKSIWVVAIVAIVAIVALFLATKPIGNYGQAGAIGTENTVGNLGGQAIGNINGENHESTIPDEIEIQGKKYLIVDGKVIKITEVTEAPVF